MHQDVEGNPWFNQKLKEDEINHGVKGVHALIPFQCESCWMVNLEGRLPDPKLDEMYLMLIRRANLDAMGGRAVTTTAAHASATKRVIRNCSIFRKTPTIPARGPMPMKDVVGMSTAVDMLFNSITAKPRLKGEHHIQFESMRRVRSTFTKSWESSAQGIQEGSAFASGFGKANLTTCPTQQEWFGQFLRGAEIRMGYATKANRSLTTPTVVRLLEIIRREAEEETPLIAREYYKVGAAVATAVCASLRGPEVFQLDLAGMISHINMGKGGIMPDRPLKTGTDLSTAPHVMVVLLGNFKGETGVHYHMVSLASTTMSGIPVRWWLEKLLDVRRDEGCHHGPAFGRADGYVSLLREYDGILHHFLAMIQQDDPELIAASDDVRASYSFFCTFRKTAEERARAANLDSSIQNAMNRWRTIENAKGGHTCFNMVEHYSHARDLMTVTWRYSYVQ